LAVAARQRPDAAEAVQDAAGTETTAAAQVAEYTARTVTLHRRRTARTRDPSAHHSDHPAVIQTTQTHT